MASTAPNNLLAARRQVDAFQRLTLTDDLRPLGDGEYWAFSVDATVSVPDVSYVAATTRLWIVVSREYPWGRLEAYPDASRGFITTFYHQYCNKPGLLEYPRGQRGVICVRTPGLSFDRRHLGREPIGDQERLGWFLERMLGWLDAAANNKLVADGDPFELPDFCEKAPTVVWSESEESWEAWSTGAATYGLAEVCHVSGKRDKDGLLAVRCFQNQGGNEIYRAAWGDLIAGKPKEPMAVWIKLPKTPVKEPYQAPMTWGEIREVFRRLEVPFDATMQRALRPVRDGDAHLCLIGFPIPKQFGDPLELMHWQAMRLPALAFGLHTRAGFRHNAKGYWREDCYDNFRPGVGLMWCKSRNWHPSQLSSRGALDAQVCEKRMAIIGAGSVGSVLAELLVRCGVREIILIDKDDLEGGNLVRHTLTLHDVGRSKVEGLGDRLQALTPHVSVTSLASTFPSLSEANRGLVAASDTLIDCSANDEVANALSKEPWNQARLIVSLSLGYGSDRCYIYIAPGGTFQLSDFETRAKPWFDLDLQMLDAVDLPGEAIGCWHPLFPARADDVWTMVGLAVREIEQAMITPPESPKLIVFERVRDGDQANGVRRHVVA